MNILIIPQSSPGLWISLDFHNYYTFEADIHRSQGGTYAYNKSWVTKKPNVITHTVYIPGPGHQFEPQLWPALPLSMNDLYRQQSLALYCLPVYYIIMNDIIIITSRQTQLYPWVQCLHWTGLVISQYLYCLGCMHLEELSSLAVEGYKNLV